ncbi:MAG TPA: hypothetical protein VIT45_14565 [Allosphingosinicella sp.]
MATAVRARLSAERRFYSWMAAMMIAIVLIGFAPSFYLRGIVPSYPRPNPSLSPFVLLHGLAFTLWLLVFWAQTALLAADRRDLHMRLGTFGMSLAVLLVPIMYLVAVGQVERANQPPFTTPLAWTAVPLAAIPSYALLIWLGWSRRREAQVHKRLMMAAALILVGGPAIGRFPIAPPIMAGHIVQQTIACLLFLPLFWWDRKSLGRFHWATKLGFGLAIASAAVPDLLMSMPAWEGIAAWLPGV